MFIPELVYIEHKLFQVQPDDYESRCMSNFLKGYLISEPDKDVLFLPFPMKQSLPREGTLSPPKCKLRKLLVDIHI